MALGDLATSAKRHAISAVVRTIIALALLLTSILVIPRLSWTPSASDLAAAGAIFGLATAVVLFIPLRWFSSRILRHLRGNQAGGRLHNVAHEIAIATGMEIRDVVVFQSALPNVGALPTGSGIVVVATSGAIDDLRRDELEALVSAQVAGAGDPWCRMATRAEIGWRFIKILALVVAPLAFFAPLMGGPALLLLAFMHFGPRTVESYRDLCADVAAVGATRHPEALSSGLRHLRPAAMFAHQLKVGGWFLPTSPFFVIGRRSLFAVEKGGKRHTSADALAMELSLRADRAQALAAGRPATNFTGRELKRRWAEINGSQTLTEAEKEAARALGRRLGAKTAEERLSDTGVHTSELTRRAEAGEDLDAADVVKAIWRDLQTAKAEHEASDMHQNRPPG